MPGTLLTHGVQQPDGGGITYLPGMPHSSGSFSAQPAPRQPPTSDLHGAETLQGSPAQGPLNSAPTGSPGGHRKRAALDAADPPTEVPPSKRLRSSTSVDEDPLSSVSLQTASQLASRLPWDVMLQCLQFRQPMIVLNVQTWASKVSHETLSPHKGSRSLHTLEAASRRACHDHG